MWLNQMQQDGIQLMQVYIGIVIDFFFFSSFVLFFINLKFQINLRLLLLKDPLYKTFLAIEKESEYFAEFEWKSIINMLDLLQPFEEATDILQQEVSPTLPLVLPTIKTLYFKLVSCFVFSLRKLITFF